MNPATVKLLEKTERAIAAGESALANGFNEDAAGRAYYAMFYVAEALLNEQGLHFRKHGGVHSAFGERFAKTGVLDRRFHQWLLAAFNKRIAADYDVDVELSAREVEEMLAQAREFHQTAREFLNANP